MQLSRHNILTRVRDADAWLLVNLLSGQADVLGLEDVRVLDEIAPYEKGNAIVASFTLSGRKPSRSKCC